MDARRLTAIILALSLAVPLVRAASVFEYINAITGELVNTFSGWIVGAIYNAMVFVAITSVIFFTLRLYHFAIPIMKSMLTRLVSELVMWMGAIRAVAPLRRFVSFMYKSMLRTRARPLRIMTGYVMRMARPMIRIGSRIGTTSVGRRLGAILGGSHGIIEEIKGRIDENIIRRASSVLDPAAKAAQQAQQAARRIEKYYVNVKRDVEKVIRDERVQRAWSRIKFVWSIVTAPTLAEAIMRAAKVGEWFDRKLEAEYNPAKRGLLYLTAIWIGARPREWLPPGASNELKLFHLHHHGEAEMTPNVIKRSAQYRKIVADRETIINQEYREQIIKNIKDLLNEYKEKIEKNILTEREKKETAKNFEILVKRAAEFLRYYGGVNVDELIERKSGLSFEESLRIAKIELEKGNAEPAWKLLEHLDVEIRFRNEEQFTTFWAREKIRKLALNSSMLNRVSEVVHQENDPNIALKRMMEIEKKYVEAGADPLYKALGFTDPETFKKFFLESYNVIKEKGFRDVEHKGPGHVIKEYWVPRLELKAREYLEQAREIDRLFTTHLFYKHVAEVIKQEPFPERTWERINELKKTYTNANPLPNENTLSKNFEEAKKNFEKAVKYNEEAEKNYALAIKYIEAKNYEEARKYYEQAEKYVKEAKKHLTEYLNNVKEIKKYADELEVEAKKYFEQFAKLTGMPREIWRAFSSPEPFETAIYKYTPTELVVKHSPVDDPEWHEFIKREMKYGDKNSVKYAEYKISPYKAAKVGWLDIRTPSDRVHGAMLKGGIVNRGELKRIIEPETSRTIDLYHTELSTLRRAYIALDELQAKRKAAEELAEWLKGGGAAKLKEYLSSGNADKEILDKLEKLRTLNIEVKDEKDVDRAIEIVEKWRTLNLDPRNIEAAMLQVLADRAEAFGNREEAKTYWARLAELREQMKNEHFGVETTLETLAELSRLDPAFSGLFLQMKANDVARKGEGGVLRKLEPAIADTRTGLELTFLNEIYIYRKSGEIVAALRRPRGVKDPEWLEKTVMWLKDNKKQISEHLLGHNYNKEIDDKLKELRRLGIVIEDIEDLNFAITVLSKLMDVDPEVFKAAEIQTRIELARAFRDGERAAVYEGEFANLREKYLDKLRSELKSIEDKLDELNKKENEYKTKLEEIQTRLEKNEGNREELENEMKRIEEEKKEKIEKERKELDAERKRIEEKINNVDKILNKKTAMKMLEELSILNTKLSEYYKSLKDMKRIYYSVFDTKGPTMAEIVEWIANFDPELAERLLQRHHSYLGEYVHLYRDHKYPWIEAAKYFGDGLATDVTSLLQMPYYIEER